MSQFLEQSGDVSAILRQIGTAISHGEASSFCLLNTPQEVGLTEEDLGGIIGRKIVATVETGALPDVVVGSLVVIDGVNHYVRRPLESDDPKLTLFLCSRSAPDHPESVEAPTSWVGNNVPFALSASSPGLPNARVLTDSATAEWNRTVDGEISLDVVGGGGGSSGGVQGFPLTSLDFDSTAREFEGLLPSPPDPSKPVFILMRGVGLLLDVTGGDAPDGAQFARSGATLQDVAFGYGPDAGDHGVAFYTPI